MVSQVANIKAGSTNRAAAKVSGLLPAWKATIADAFENANARADVRAKMLPNKTCGSTWDRSDISCVLGCTTVGADGRTQVGSATSRRVARPLYLSP